LFGCLEGLFGCGGEPGAGYGGGDITELQIEFGAVFEVVGYAKELAEGVAVLGAGVGFSIDGGGFVCGEKVLDGAGAGDAGFGAGELGVVVADDGGFDLFGFGARVFLGEFFIAGFEAAGVAAPAEGEAKVIGELFPSDSGGPLPCREAGVRGRWRGRVCRGDRFWLCRRRSSDVWTVFILAVGALGFFEGEVDVGGGNGDGAVVAEFEKSLEDLAALNVHAVAPYGAGDAVDFEDVGVGLRAAPAVVFCFAGEEAEAAKAVGGRCGLRSGGVWGGPIATDGECGCEYEEGECGFHGLSVSDVE
jgi:hypothetical protein